MWYLIVSIPDLCLLPYFNMLQTLKEHEFLPAHKNQNAEKVIGPVKQKYLLKIVIIFLSISLNMCFGCSKEPSL